MKVTYDPEADVLCFHLRDRPPVDAVEEPEGVIVSYGEDGDPVSVEFMDAAERGLTSADEISVTVQTAARQFTAT
jgi:uncharacterized protein YuzE